MPTIMGGHLKLQEKTPDLSDRGLITNQEQEKLFQSEPAENLNTRKSDPVLTTQPLEGDGNDVPSFQLFLKKLLVYCRFRLKYINRKLSFFLWRVSGHPRSPSVWLKRRKCSLSCREARRCQRAEVRLSGLRGACLLAVDFCHWGSPNFYLGGTEKDLEIDSLLGFIANVLFFMCSVVLNKNNVLFRPDLFSISRRTSRGV